MSEPPLPKIIGPGLTQKHPTRNCDVDLPEPDLQLGFAVMSFIFSQAEASFGPLMMRALTTQEELSDCPFVANGWPVYSRRLVEALGQSARTHPVTMQFNDKAIDKEAYLLCTPKEHFDGLDLDRSVFEPNRFNPKAPDRVAKPVLRNDVNWPSYFRLERYHTLALVNQEMQLKLRDLGLRGVRFEDISTTGWSQEELKV
jgi:hypothetical protein